MKVYNVTLVRTITQAVTVEIEAESSEQAEDMAWGSKLAWETQDIGNEWVDSIEEVST